MLRCFNDFSVFLRSGMAFFRFVWEHIQAGNLLETLTENVSSLDIRPMKIGDCGTLMFI